MGQGLNWKLVRSDHESQTQPSCLIVKMTHLWNIHQYAGEHDAFIAAHLTNATLKCCWMCEIPLSVLKSHTVSPEFNFWGVFVLLSAAFCYHRRRTSWNTGSGSVWQRRLPWTTGANFMPFEEELRMALDAFLGGKYVFTFLPTGSLIFKMPH